MVSYPRGGSGRGGARQPTEQNGSRAPGAVRRPPDEGRGRRTGERKPSTNSEERYSERSGVSGGDGADRAKPNHTAKWRRCASKGLAKRQSLPKNIVKVVMTLTIKFSYDLDFTPISEQV